MALEVALQVGRVVQFEAAALRADQLMRRHGCDRGWEIEQIGPDLRVIAALGGAQRVPPRHRLREGGVNSYVAVDLEVVMLDPAHRRIVEFYHLTVAQGILGVEQCMWSAPVRCCHCTPAAAGEEIQTDQRLS